MRSLVVLSAPMMRNCFAGGDAFQRSRVLRSLVNVLGQECSASQYLRTCRALNLLILLVTPAGVEPATPRLESGGTSNSFKAHSDNSRHVHAMARQTVSARVRMAC